LQDSKISGLPKGMKIQIDDFLEIVQEAAGQ
jgi:hypothetical protein